MLDHLMRRSTEALLKMGGMVLPKLMADEKLSEPAAMVGRAYAELASAAAVSASAMTAFHEAVAARDDEGRKFYGELRELGMVLLCAGGNHHHVGTYALLFPEGYGMLRSLDGPEAIQFSDRVVTLLESETNPKLLRYRHAIRELCDEFSRRESALAAARRWRTDARAYERAAKRRFVRALGRGRALMSSIYDEDPRFVRETFAPIYKRKSRGGAGSEVPGVAAVPDAANDPELRAPWIEGAAA
jgi:hypothetical protein